MLWRNAPGSGQQFFAIERSVNSSGAWTGTYATLWTIGVQANINNSACYQQSLVFGVGAAPGLPPSNNQNTGGFLVKQMAGGAFNGSIPFDTCAPDVGWFDYPCTSVGSMAGGDFTEGVTFTTSLYGSTRTYLPSKNGQFSLVSIKNFGAGGLCMRYD